MRNTFEQIPAQKQPAPEEALSKEERRKAITSFYQEKYDHIPLSPSQLETLKKLKQTNAEKFSFDITLSEEEWKTQKEAWEEEKKEEKSDIDKKVEKEKREIEVLLQKIASGNSSTEEQGMGSRMFATESKPNTEIKTLMFTDEHGEYSPETRNNAQKLFEELQKFGKKQNNETLRIIQDTDPDTMFEILKKINLGHFNGIVIENLFNPKPYLDDDRNVIVDFIKKRKIQNQKKK